MKTNQLTFGFVVLLLFLALQGSAKGENANTPDTAPTVTATNESVGSTEQMPALTDEPVGIVTTTNERAGSTEQNTNLAPDDVHTFDETKGKAEKGDAEAQFNLGLLYDRGKGVAEDDAEVAKWYLKAAEQGDASGQNDLAICYENGDGVIEDYVQADKWFNLASAQNWPTARQNLSSLEQSMTPDQIALAQQLAREFVPQKETPGSSTNSFNSPDNPTASGTGFFITDDGFLVTCAHVVAGATKIQLVTRAGTIDASVVQTDAANDIALLKADGKFSALPVAASRTARLGDTVATVGFPDPDLQGFSPKLAKGEISALAGAQDDPHYFQISLPVQPGNSGGALVDEHGNVVGIVAAKLDAATALAASGALPENVNYAVKSSFLLSFLESVPDADANLKSQNTSDEKFPVVVKAAQDATVLVLVY